MGCEVSLAAGELAGAREYAERLAALPCYRDYAHPALARRLQVDLLSGDLTGAVRRGDSFLASWERAGRHRAPTLAVGTYSLAVVHGLVGNDSELEAWRAVTEHLRDDSMTPTDGPGVGWAPTLDAWLSLHRDQPHAALEILAADLDDPQWRRQPHLAHVATLVRRCPSRSGSALRESGPRPAADQGNRRGAGQPRRRRPRTPCRGPRAG